MAKFAMTGKAIAIRRRSKASKQGQEDVDSEGMESAEPLLSLWSSLEEEDEEDGDNGAGVSLSSFRSVDTKSGANTGWGWLEVDDTLGCLRGENLWFTKQNTCSLCMAVQIKKSR